MRHVLMARGFLAAIALSAVVGTAVLNGCGGSSGSTVGPSPTPTATPGQAFVGTFAGTVPLDSGRTGAVTITTKADETATGTLTITGGTQTETVPLTGFVALTNGDFSLSGSSADGSVNATVSGTLPAPGAASGFLAIQIGTSIFEGTISAA